MKNLLLGLEPHTAKAAALMKDLGISAKEGAADSFYQLNGNLKPLPEIIDILNQKFGGLNDKQKEAALATTFTKYGLAGLNTIVGESRDKFLAFQKELKMDDAATIAAKKYDNLHGDFIKLGAATQTMAKAFGDTLAPALRGVVQGVTQVVAWITQLPKPVKEAGLVALGLASALAIAAGSIISTSVAFKMMGPGLDYLAGALGLAEFSIGGVTVALLEMIAPFALVAAGIAVLAYAFTHNLGGIKDKTMEAVNYVKNLFNSLKTAFTDLWSGTGGKGISILDNLGFSSSAISAVQNAIARIKEGIDGLKKGFDTAKKAVEGIFMVLSGTGGGKGIDILQKLGFSKSTINELMQMGGHIKAIMDGIKNTFTSTVDGIGNYVRPVISSLLNFWNTHQYQFRQTVETVWNAIGNALRTAVTFMINTIGPALTTVFNWWNEYWPEMQTAFQVVWRVILAILTPAILEITAVISAALGFIRGAWQSGWAAIGSYLKMTWDLIKGDIEIAWHLISGIISVALDLLSGNFRKAGSDFLNIFKNIWHDITSMWSSWGQDAYQFGVNFVKMLASGITSAVGAVTSAVSGVANQVKNFLGWHSPTKVGPGADSDKWAPNFVNMMAKGIQEHTPKIQAAVNGIALSMKTGVTAVNHNISQQNISIPSNRGGGNITNHFHIEGSNHTPEQIAEKIVDKIYRQMPVVS